MKTDKAVTGFPSTWKRDIASDCWIWTASVRRGYGQVKRNEKNAFAHRAAYEHYVGEIPKGLCVLHRCDNTLCVNPQHLFLGSQQDNVKDMMRKGRSSRKISDEAVHLIRQSKLSCSALARELGISHTTVSRIKNRLIWKHLQ